ncbi:sigma 54-interacting transcriptional regulator [candidate division KSB1 bacterium]
MLDGTYKIVGNHPEIRNVRRRIRRVALHNRNVLITGEPGTEKELIAREIHRKSLRKPDVFEIIDCYDLNGQTAQKAQEKLVDSCLKSRSGTLYIDNIHLLSRENQIELCRLIGSLRGNRHNGFNHKTSIRVISAAHDAGLVSDSSFDKQLFVIISEYVINIPPLRFRKGDIPLIFDYYYSVLVEQRGYKEAPAVPDDIMESIIKHEWRGNVQELVKSIETLLDMSPKNELTPEALPFVARKNPMAFLDQFDYHAAMNKVDEYKIRSALEKFGWNQTRAAAYLNMTEGNIRLKMKKYSIHRSTLMHNE